MTLVSLISYVDRNTLALLAPTILRDTGLSTEQYGYIVSAFSFAYMVGSPMWGMLLDRFGLRRGMAAAVALWSAASGAHAYASGLVGFSAARALLGFGEGATFPGGLRTAVQTLPIHLQSRGIAVAYSGGSLGAIVTPLIVTPVAVAFGWRGAFWFTAAIGFVWLILWAFIGRLVPGAHDAEAPKGWALPIDRKVGAFIAAYALGALPLAFVIYGSSIYLARVRGFSQAHLGAVLWVPPVGWELGYFFWGWVADRFGPVTGNRGRMLMGIAAVLSLPLALAPAISGDLPFLMALLFAMFAGAGFIILSIAYATRTMSVESSGLIAGLGAGSWSAAVAVFMPLMGRMFDRGLYEQAFVVSALIPLAGFALWLTLDARR